MLDVDAINQEFTFGGEKGQRMLDDTDMTNIMDIVVKEVYRLAQECVDHMSKMILSIFVNLHFRNKGSRREEESRSRSRSRRGLQTS